MMPMRSLQSVVWLTLAAVALGPVSGCNKPAGATSEPAGLKAAMRPYFLDVPLPEGFRRVEKLSTDRLSGDLRYVQHVYDGPASPEKVRSFYEEQMPLARWEWVNTRNDQGVHTLAFVKDGEQCEIKISPRWQLLGTGSRVEVRIDPRDQTQPAAGKVRP